MTPKERRASSRVHIEVEVTLESESHFFTGLSGDLSKGGIFLSTYQRLEVGRPVQMEFTLPGGKVVARGTVQWARAASEGASPGVGVAFESLSDADRAIIAAFCEQRPPLYYEVGDRPSHAG